MRYSLSVIILCLLTAAAFPCAGIAADVASDDEIPVVFHPRRRAILSARIQSTITAIHREEGRRFKAGENLIELDPKLHQASLEKTEARLNSTRIDIELFNKTIAMANVTKAEAQLKSVIVRRDNRKSLFKDKAISVSEMADADAAVDVARANVVIAKEKLAEVDLEKSRASAAKKVAEADVRMAREQVKACTITAPISGQVVKLFVQEHESVQPGQKLIEILDDEILLAQFFLPSSNAARVGPGDMVVIMVQETGSKVTGRISHLSSEVDPATSTLTVYAEVENPSGKKRILSGMRGIIKSIAGKEPGSTGVSH